MDAKLQRQLIKVLVDQTNVVAGILGQSLAQRSRFGGLALCEAVKVGGNIAGLVGYFWALLFDCLFFWALLGPLKILAVFEWAGIEDLKVR